MKPSVCYFLFLDVKNEIRAKVSRAFGILLLVLMGWSGIAFSQTY